MHNSCSSCSADIEDTAVPTNIVQYNFHVNSVHVVYEFSLSLNSVHVVYVLFTVHLCFLHKCIGGNTLVLRLVSTNEKSAFFSMKSSSCPIVAPDKDLRPSGNAIRRQHRINLVPFKRTIQFRPVRALGVASQAAFDFVAIVYTLTF